MSRVIIVLCILFIGLLIFTRNEEFFTSTDLSVAPTMTEITTAADKKSRDLGAVAIIQNIVAKSSNSDLINIDNGTQTLKQKSSSLITTIPEKSPTEIPDAYKLAEICEKAPNECRAFDDATFAANCGMSFDVNGTDRNGNPHKGGLYIKKDDRASQTAEVAKVIQAGTSPYDQYKVYQPTLGSATRGKFSITKDSCIVVKEKVDCLAKQTFASPNCSQCYSSRDFSRVGPETGRLPSTLYLTGNGKVAITDSISLASQSLSTNPISVPLSANEGATFTITVDTIAAPTYIAGYIEGPTSRGPYKLDMFTVVQRDNITGAKPRINGSVKVNEFKCMSIIPGSGKTSIALSCIIPFSFLNPQDIDAMGCDNGPMITKETSAVFLESDPCFNKANKPGAYKLECLQSRWLNLGGTQEGTGYPNTQVKADAIQTANGTPLDINTIVDALSVRMSKALTGNNENNTPLSIEDWNTESMYTTGVKIETPCDGPGAGTQRCQSYIYKNEGVTSHIGPTYTAPVSYATKKEGFDDMPPQSYNQPGTPLDPMTPSGKAFADQFGTNIGGLKQAYDNITYVANDNTKKNSQRSTELKQAYDINLQSVASSGRNDFDVHIDANNATKSYAEMKSVCEAQGMRLCQSGELCDMSTRKVIQPEITTSFPTDNWIAVGDSDNEWLTLNNMGERYCKTHTEVAGSKPSWGPTNTVGPWARLAKCCTGSSNMLGRYITLQYNRVECLNLGEIEVYSDKGTKNIVTPQMRVTKPSGYSGDGFPVRNYTDGNPGTFVHTSCYDVPWITIDLGRVYPIYRIVIKNRVDCCQWRILGSYLFINADGSANNVYKSDPITSVNQTYTWFPPNTSVYGDVPLGAPPPIRQKVYGNNGSTTCERYCSGLSGGPWNNELPVNWNGARCDAVDPVIGNCYTNFMGHSGAPCSCVQTGRGWRSGGWAPN